MNLNKKGQAILDFLITYGWAFLVLIVMLSALTYFGVMTLNQPTKEVESLGFSVCLNESNVVYKCESGQENELLFTREQMRSVEKQLQDCEDKSLSSMEKLVKAIDEKADIVENQLPSPEVPQ